MLIRTMLPARTRTIRTTADHLARPLVPFSRSRSLSQFHQFHGRPPLVPRGRRLAPVLWNGPRHDHDLQHHHHQHQHHYQHQQHLFRSDWSVSETSNGDTGNGGGGSAPKVNGPWASSSWSAWMEPAKLAAIYNHHDDSDDYDHDDTDWLHYRQVALRLIRVPPGNLAPELWVELEEVLQWSSQYVVNWMTNEQSYTHEQQFTRKLAHSQQTIDWTVRLVHRVWQECHTRRPGDHEDAEARWAFVRQCLPPRVLNQLLHSWSMLWGDLFCDQVNQYNQPDGAVPSRSLLPIDRDDEEDDDDEDDDAQSPCQTLDR